MYLSIFKKNENIKFIRIYFLRKNENIQAFKSLQSYSTIKQYKADTCYHRNKFQHYDYTISVKIDIDICTLQHYCFST